MIIDLHCHTSKSAMRNMHVTSATIEDLEQFAAQYGIDLIVLLATYFPHKKSGVHNYDMLERIKDKPLFKMFGSLDVPNHLDEGIAELETLAEQGLISGIKLYVGYQEFHASDPRVWPVYKIAEKYRLPIMYHGGEVCHNDKKFSELARPIYVEKPACEFPTVKFVMSHLGNPYFDEFRGVMARHPNVWTDISGLFRSGSEEASEEYKQEMAAEIEKFLAGPNGVEHVCFATDFPIQSYADSFDLIKRTSLTGMDLEKVMSGNALQILDRNFVP